MENPIVSGAPFPPLQKTQERGTQSFEMGMEKKHKGRATRHRKLGHSMIKWHALLCFVATLVGGNAFGADCTVPHYNRGKVYVNSTSEIAMQISVSPSDLAPVKLVCFSTDFRRHHSGARKILLTIYDNIEAAKLDRPLTVEANPSDLARFGHMHAAYSYNADKLEEYVMLYPDPLRKDLGTRIDISSARTNFLCALKVSDRCLLALRHIEYPWTAKKDGVSGVVTLTAVIGRDGIVKDVQTKTTDANTALATYAVENIRTWRFEPGGSEISVTTNYTFQLVSSPIYQSGSDVRISLPDKIVVTDNPPR